MLTTITVGRALAKRFVEEQPQGPNLDLPPVTVWLFLIDMVLFIPLLMVVGYTFGHLYPTLAAVEDPLPDYEALSMNDDGTPKADNDPVVHTAQPGKPVTGSVRAINRLVRSHGPGWAANFRGITYAAVVGVVIGAATLFLAVPLFVPMRIAHLIALLALAPLSTAWTHVVITPRSAESFFRRIPALKKTYTATWLPTVAFWAAVHLATGLAQLLANTLGLKLVDRTAPASRGEVCQGLAVLLFILALQALLVIPAHTALTRVQASLLPADRDAIVPFDRSFGGRVEPEVVTGKGFATLGAALATVSRASWCRIYLLRVKLFGAAVLAYLAMGAVVAVQVLMVSLVVGSKGGGKE
ncbi:hypothetical protein BT67DRAFT_309260 [Trichocladium antarcticum]|uniref:Ubiquitin carrier protein n=1 Tax=Trichocladium antarcticum TaxID=1450529 RepID=A0AAN6ZDS6_9PEZI|nr:hypothetical protein BT67DRAFT_309260 [Trichocladium antarcticum]